MGREGGGGGEGGLSNWICLTRENYYNKLSPGIVRDEKWE